MQVIEVQKRPPNRLCPKNGHLQEKHFCGSLSFSILKDLTGKALNHPPVAPCWPIVI